MYTKIASYSGTPSSWKISDQSSDASPTGIDTPKRDRSNQFKNPDGWTIFDKWEQEENDYILRRGVVQPIPEGRIFIPRKRLTLDITRDPCQTRSAHAATIYADFLGRNASTLTRMSQESDLETTWRTMSTSATSTIPAPGRITLRQQMDATVQSMMSRLNLTYSR